MRASSSNKRAAGSTASHGRRSARRKANSSSPIARLPRSRYDARSDMAIGMAIALISAIIGAVLGAYLQRRWTPDYSAQLEALRQQVAGFQQRVEALERERSETERPAPTIRLDQAVADNYVMLVEHQFDDALSIEQVILRKNGVDLSRTNRPAKADWTIPPRSAKQISWSPNPDPISTLRYIDPNVGTNTPIELEFVLVCTVRNKPRTFRRKISVMTSFGNQLMTQWAG